MIRSVLSDPGRYFESLKGHASAIGTRFRRFAPSTRPWATLFCCAAIGSIPVLVLFVDASLTRAVALMDREFIGLIDDISDAANSKWYLVPIALVIPVILFFRAVSPAASNRRVLAWIASALGFTFVAIAASGILNYVFKVLFGRARPKLMLREDIYGFFPPAFDAGYQSFPSGHANTAMALAVTAALLFPRIRVAAIGIGAAVALCRVGATAHFLSDAIAGGALAVATTVWLRALAGNRNFVFEPIGRGGYRVAAPGRLIIRRFKRAAINALSISKKMVRNH